MYFQPRAGWFTHYLRTFSAGLWKSHRWQLMWSWLRGVGLLEPLASYTPLKARVLANKTMQLFSTMSKLDPWPDTTRSLNVLVNKYFARSYKLRLGLPLMYLTKVKFHLYRLLPYLLTSSSKILSKYRPGLTHWHLTWVCQNCWPGNHVTWWFSSNYAIQTITFAHSYGQR